jgi:anti-anti-sigma factor
MRAFKIEKAGTVESGTIEVKLEGQIGIEEAARVSAFFEDLEKAGTTWVIVNLKGVDFISTAGVGALLYAVGGARKRGGDIVFAEPSPKTKAVFEFLDLHDFIVTTADTTGALAAVKDLKTGARPKPK